MGEVGQGLEASAADHRDWDLAWVMMVSSSPMGELVVGHNRRICLPRLPFS